MTAGKKRKQKKKTHYRATAVICTVIFALIWVATPRDAAWKQTATWQRMTEPGALSKAHAHLENNCSACHEPVRGVTTEKCIVCHANDKAVLQRQPTAFHAGISSCVECHLEHRGGSRRPTEMDHQALARIGMRQLGGSSADSENEALREFLVASSSTRKPPHNRISSIEATLDCATCHRNDDRHFTLFGMDCAECHATDRWSIPEFRHPSPGSMDCAQCHQAPPSHYMMHFTKISRRVAGKPKARIDQCFQCHQTNSWNDIKNAGWYKHH